MERGNLREGTQLIVGEQQKYCFYWNLLNDHLSCLWMIPSSIFIQTSHCLLQVVQKQQLFLQLLLQCETKAFSPFHCSVLSSVASRDCSAFILHSLWQILIPVWGNAAAGSSGNLSWDLLYSFPEQWLKKLLKFRENILWSFIV